jgi:hypothetical protein
MPPSCRWLWNSGGGANECWTAYSSSESAQIERLFAAGADRCALGAERHVDFRSMRQVRDDNPSRYRAIRREAPAGPSGAEAGATPAAVLAAQEAAAEAPSASTSAAMAGAAPVPAEATVALAGSKRMRASDASIGGGDRSGSSIGNASGNSDNGGGRDGGDGGTRGTRGARGDGDGDGRGDGGGDGGNIFQAKRQSLAPIATPRSRMGTPSVPLHPPFTAPASWPTTESKLYDVLLMTDQEDPAFRAMLDACLRVGVEQCVQRDGTRHVTLFKGLKLTPDEAMRVGYSSPPACLPMRLSTEHLMPWDTCIALGFSSNTIPAADLAALADLDLPSRLSSKLRIKPSNLHISLYRTAGRSLSEQVKDEAKRLIPSIRAACGGFPFGSVFGTKVVLKLSGGDYNEANWRVLA